MRRRTVVRAYLALLLLSTVARGLLLSRERTQLGGWVRGPAGSPVVILGDAGDYWGGAYSVTSGIRRTHRWAIVADGEDPRPLLQSLVATPVHLIAVGTAGPEAITLAAMEPGAIKSLALVDADGIEEFDLLGDHHLNQVLRRAQVVSTEAVRWLVPHFGLLDVATSASEERAKRLLSYDRRTLREDLARWGGPTAILTGTTTRNRMLTAREHARLLPQSFLASPDPDSLAAFIDRVDAGTAATRATAPAARIAAAALPFDARGIASAEGSALYVVLLLLALATLLSEDLACVTAGVLAARGSIPLLPGIAACYVGIVAGDQLLYLLGRSAGRALVTRVPIKWILPADRLDRAVEWFRTHGMRVVLTSRLLPGTRSTVYVAAGILRAGFVRFALWLVVIGAIWTPALVGLSYVATQRGRGLIEALPGPTWPWALGAMLGGTLLVRWILSAATPEGRAGLRSRWRGEATPQ